MIGRAGLALVSGLDLLEFLLTGMVYIVHSLLLSWAVEEAIRHGLLGLACV